MTDRDSLKLCLEKLGIADREEEVLNKANKFGPTTKFEGDKLIWLDLSNMGLTEVSKDTFVGLSNLKELKLFKNEIVSISETSFDELINLTELHLKDNKIEKLTKRHFEKLPLLDRLFLLGNEGLGAAARVYPNKPAVINYISSL